jgi:hypothetical protein
MTPKEQVDVLVEEAGQLATHARDAWYADDAIFIGDLKEMADALDVLVREHRRLIYGGGQ